MLLRCVIDNGGALPPHQRGLFYTSETQFDVEIGDEHTVYALGLFESGLIALIVSKSGIPVWYPLELFEVVSDRLPPDWVFAFFGDDKPEGLNGLPGWQARWGYREIVSSDAHLDGLIEADPEALRIFHEERARRSGASDELP